MTAFEGSGLSATEFCRRRGLSKGTLGWWRWRLRHEQPEVAAATDDVRLVPVEIVGALERATAPRRSALVAVTFEGLAVEFEAGTDVAYVGALVRALRPC
ncbi:MAG: IS66 family insertion sequence element accessory protein TnpB [Polyangiaceae bacterium]|nr:IS66 family insertion sequence element accessory protein TnpB [Polyangiaceae bacterium]